MNIRDMLYEKKHRMIDFLYFWFGTDEYYDIKEPKLLYNQWICNSIEWKLFDTYKEAEEALRKIGKEPV